MEEEPLQIIKNPGKGREGRGIKVRTNFFEILSLPTNTILHFDITITPTVPPRLNLRIFERFVELYRDSDLGGTRPVYDGRNNMFTNKRLAFDDAGTFDVRLPEDGPATSRRPPRDFVVQIKKVAEFNMNDLINFINANGQLTRKCLTAIMALDVLVRHKLSTRPRHVSVGRSFYTPRDRQSLSEGLEVWQGYYQSVRPTWGKMMVNIDLSATVFYEGGPLLQLITRILGRRSPDDLRRGILDRDLDKIERIIKGVQIRDNHRAGNQRKFKIMKLTPTPASRTTFDRDGRITNVVDYFYEQYNIRINYGQLPCVVVRGNNYLPIEVCDVIEGQRYMRKLGKQHIKEMIDFTRQRPHTRVNKINEGVRRVIDYRANENMQQFGMRVSEEMAVVNARVLPIPMLQYHPSSLEANFRPREGAWNLRNKKVATGATLGSWSVLSFSSERELPEPAIRHFVRELINTCQDTGLNIPNRNPPIMYAGAQSRTEDALKRVWLKAGNTAKAQPQLIICILPNDGKPLYAEIKRVSDTVIGVATQCIQSHFVIPDKRKPINQQTINKQYCANVCLKINVKLGGMNSFLNPGNIPFITETPTILIGADVTHPKPGSTGPSIAALCATMDAKASRYAASIRVQDSQTEIIAEMANMVKELLKTFFQTCGRKPERILLYRDGVSEGQFQQVLTDEVSAVKAACQALEAEYKPRITFVVVQKRHHARFFPLDRRDSDRSENCLPGTVVDTDITHPFEFDFYLQSHAGIQGTSRPAHYHVLYDQNGFNADSLQTLSYNLCYLYARCTRSVSLVPPIYYANLICARARLHTPWGDTGSSADEGAETAAMFGEVKPELQRVMYFI